MNGKIALSHPQHTIPTRSPQAIIENQVAVCLENPIIKAILNCVEGFALILNEHRQVVTVNGALMRVLDEQDQAHLRGLRPGEVLQCVHSQEGLDGCGSSAACPNCVALITILASQCGTETCQGECSLLFSHGEHAETRLFSVRATRVPIADYQFVVLVMRDVSLEKRKDSLERLFLHDLMNTLQGLRGWSELIHYPQTNPKQAAQHIERLSEHLALEVKAQQMLLQAEGGQLTPLYADVEIQSFLRELEAVLLKQRCCGKREIRFSHYVTTLKSDPGILMRILLNMLINALEATPEGGWVSLDVLHQENAAHFRVHNPGVMPPEVAAGIFQRSVTTKGQGGRGMGTYSMKMLAEVLGGCVRFESNASLGTLFELIHPYSSAASPK